MGVNDIRHSIVIVSYNQEKYIINAIKSIFEQEIPPYELVILDDCSSDSTAKLAREYIAANPHSFHCQVIVNESNLGIPRNMQKAAVVSSGNVLSLLAADDVWFSNGTRCVKNGIENSQLNPDKDNFVCFAPTLSMNPDGSNRFVTNYVIYKDSALRTMIRKCAPFGKIGFSRSALIGVDYPVDIGLWADWVWDVSICDKVNKYYEINELCFVHYGQIGVSSNTDVNEIDESYWRACIYLLEKHKKEFNFFDRMYLVGEKYYLLWKIKKEYQFLILSLFLMILNSFNCGSLTSFKSMVSRYMPEKIIEFVRKLSKIL